MPGNKCSNLKNLALKFNLATMKIKKCYSISRGEKNLEALHTVENEINKNIPNSLLQNERDEKK